MKDRQFLWGITQNQATVFCGAVRSTTIKTTLAVPTATGSIRITGATISVFVSACAPETLFDSLISDRLRSRRL